jgi:hypothetical protein
MNKEQVFQTAREQVSNSYPSIFTKDDVIRLLVDLEKSMEGVKSESKGITKEKLQEILDKYNEDMREFVEHDVDTRNMWSDDDIQFSVSYREICVDDVEINLDPVCNSIRDFKHEFDIDEYFEEEEEDNVLVIGSEFVSMDDDDSSNNE